MMFGPTNRGDTPLSVLHRLGIAVAIGDLPKSPSSEGSCVSAFHAAPLAVNYRPDGWELRLNEVLKKASTTQFHPKTWNCATFAAECVEAITGEPVSRVLRVTLESSVDALLPRVQPRQALRGDVVLADIPHKTLGVCTGSVAAFVGVNGLETRPMSEVIAAWRV